MDWFKSLFLANMVTTIITGICLVIIILMALHLVPTNTVIEDVAEQVVEKEIGIKVTVEPKSIKK